MPRAAGPRTSRRDGAIRCSTSNRPDMRLNRLFVANRGEIAVRILRTARRLGLGTVLGVSAADTESLGAEMADRVVVLGPAPSAKSYLDVRLVVHAAKGTGCDALHPGY